MKVVKLENKKLTEEELRSNQNMHEPEDVHTQADLVYGVAREVDTAAQEHVEDVFDELEKNAEGITPKTPDDGDVKIPKNMYAEKITLDESLFTEDAEDSNEIAEFLKDSVEWLIDEQMGCSTYKLNDRLGICIGWQDGFDANDDDVIHSNDEPTWAIVAGIKVYTSDDMRTDYDWISYPYFANGDTVDTSVSVSPNEDYDKLANYFIGEFDDMKDWEIEEDGLVIESDGGEEDAVEESCKGKKCSKKLKEGNNNKLMDAVKYAYGFTNKEAREWIRNATDEQKELIIKGFEDDAKKSFLNDSLKEDVSAFNLNDDVKDWYVSTFPDDELGAEIGERSPNGISFKFIAKLLDKGIDVYDFIPHDSVVRERIFAELAKRMGVEYDDVYDAWLNSDIRAKATELERRSAYKTLNGTENVYDVPKEYRGVLDKRFVKESLSPKHRRKVRESKSLKEGTSNFWSMDKFPLLVFMDYDLVYDKAFDDTVKELGYPDIEMDEEITDTPEFEKNFEIESQGVATLAEWDLGELEEVIGDFNDKLKNEYYENHAEDWDGDDDARVELKDGYYEGCQIYVPNERYLADWQADMINDFLKTLKEKYGLTELGVSYRASNGETGYHKIGEGKTTERRKGLKESKGSYIGYEDIDETKYPNLKEALNWDAISIVVYGDTVQFEKVETDTLEEACIEVEDIKRELRKLASDRGLKYANDLHAYVKESKLTEKKGEIEELPDNVWQLVYDRLFPGNKNFRPKIATNINKIYDYEDSIIMNSGLGVGDWDIGVAVAKEEDSDLAKAVADELHLATEYRPTKMLRGRSGVIVIKIPEDIATKDAAEYVTSIGLDMATIRPKRGKK